MRSCLIDGEVVCCDERGLRSPPGTRLPLAFDLLELDGQDLRREPLEVRKATLASILRRLGTGVRLNAHLGTHAG